MPYVKPVPATKIALRSDENYFVMWRPRLKYGEIRTASKSGMSTNRAGEVSIDNVQVMDSMLLSHIEDWNLDDDNGVKLPLNSTSLLLLDEQDVEQLSELLRDGIQEQETERKN
jgi:hypothetical protein